MHSKHKQQATKKNNKYRNLNLGQNFALQIIVFIKYWGEEGY